MKYLKNNLANVLTLGNLLSGSIGAIHLLSGDYATTAWCIVFSLILDFFDGFVARATKSSSEIGLQLDSLADMVSFGFLPGLVLYEALSPFGSQFLGIVLPFEIKYFGLLVTLFSGLRLAIFNLDTEQKYYFKGLNTPSNTLLLFGLYYSFKELGGFSFLFESEVLLALLTLLCSWLLISPIKMIALKFKSMKLEDNYPKLALLIGVVILSLIFQVQAIPIAVLYYILISIVFHKNLN